MNTSPSLRRLLGGAAVVMLAAATIGCGLDGVELPSAPTGPSGAANAITLTASPTSLPRDGSSVATVTVRASDVTGGPLAGQRVGIAVTPSEATASATEVVTDSSGRATFTVTAPPSTSGANDIAVTVTPIGGFSDQAARNVSIGLLGTPIGSVPAPTVTLAIAPDPPQVNQNATFTAAASPATGRRITQYTWNFGDGTTQTTTVPTVVKQFTSTGTFVVTVTVTDDLGQTGSASLQVTLGAGTPPTATFTFSPSSPGQFEVIQFTAEASRANETGRTIARYDWNFGDGSTATGVTTSHAYNVRGTYTVTLTVTDSAGVQGTTSQTIEVVSGVSAAFTVSPTNPAAGDDVIFDAEASQGSSTGFGGRNPIVEYIWNFGDPSDPGLQSTPNRIITHSYSQGGRTYTVVLTVVDSAGRRATTSQVLTVSTATP